MKLELHYFSENNIHEINCQRRYFHRIQKNLKICGRISRYVYDNFGFPVAAGYFKRGRLIDYSHCWNELPDGSILDCSADQFGWHGIEVILCTDKRFRYYQKEMYF